MMLRNAETYFFAHFKAAIVGAKKKLWRFVRIFVGQDDAAVVPNASEFDSYRDKKMWRARGDQDQSLRKCVVKLN